jgi:hypothetical protein
MSDETSNSLYKGTILTGSNDFAEWEGDIQAVLAAKDLLDYIYDTVGTLDDKDEHRKARKTWGTVFMSLSADVKANLSGEARDARGGNAVTLWNEIREQHSALSGARTAQLIEVLFGTKIANNESSLHYFAKMDSAHTQINSHPKDYISLSSSVLAFAFL